MFTVNLLVVMIMPLLVNGFYNGVPFTKHQSAAKISVPTIETSLHAKITPNQGESMDMYRKVRCNQTACKHFLFIRCICHDSHLLNLMSGTIETILHSVSTIYFFHTKTSEPTN